MSKQTKKFSNSKDDSESKDPGTNHQYFPKRYVVAILGFLGAACIYAMQVNLNMTVLAMSQDTKNSSGTVVECPMLLQTDTKSDLRFVGARYDWDTQEQGLILGAFYYGFLITQLPGGYMSLYLSPKWIFGTGIYISSLLCIATPAAAALGTTALVSVRVLQGLSQGVTKPALSAIISRWAPKYERSRMNTFIGTGGLLGSVVSMTLSGLISSSDCFGGWPSVFSFFGIITCVWFAFWISFMYDNPEQHPYITPSEILHFKENKEEMYEKKPIVPWKDIFSSMPVWAIIVSHFGMSFGFLTLFTELPNYMEHVLHFNLRENGVLSALPYVVQTITAWMSSYVADKLRESKKLHITTIRKIFNSIGLYGTAFFLMIVTISECRSYLIVGLICMALACNGFSYSGYHVTHIDMSPKLAGTLSGISNTFATVSGILAPAMVGFLTSYGESILEWNRVFYIVVAVYVLCGTFYNLFASAELQPWGIETENTVSGKMLLERKPCY